MSKKKTPLEKIVDATVRAVLKGGEDKDVINQLCCMQEQINFQNYSKEEMQQYFPNYSDFDVKEMKKIRMEVFERLKAIVQNPETTYLQTFRIVVAVNAMELSVPAKSNPRVKFCQNYWRMCCAEGKRVDYYMKEIKLLDKKQ